MQGGIKVTAMILIAAFAVDRVASGILFLLSFLGPWRQRFPEPQLEDTPALRYKAEKHQKLAYFSLAGVFGAYLVYNFPQMKFLSALGIQVNAGWDLALTVLALMGGADRIAELAKSSGSAAASRSSSAAPIVVTGKLTLDESTPRVSGTPAR